MIKHTHISFGKSVLTIHVQTDLGELEENNRLSEKGNNCCSLEQFPHAAVHENGTSFSQVMEKNDASFYWKKNNTLFLL